MLTGNEIMQRRACGDIQIVPFNPAQLNPNSYNLRLADEIVIYNEAVLDSHKVNKTEKIRIPPEGIVLSPGRVYLASTEEWTETYNLIPCIDGRSSVGRLGIGIHMTAGFGDIGFKGRWTLEIYVQQPVRVYAGDELCQIYYELPDGEITDTYHGKYQGQNGTVESRMWQDGEC